MTQAGPTLRVPTAAAPVAPPPAPPPLRPVSGSALPQQEPLRPLSCCSHAQPPQPSPYTILSSVCDKKPSKSHHFLLNKCLLPRPGVKPFSTGSRPVFISQAPPPGASGPSPVTTVPEQEWAAPRRPASFTPEPLPRRGFLKSAAVVRSARTTLIAQAGASSFPRPLAGCWRLSYKLYLQVAHFTGKRLIARN